MNGRTEPPPPRRRTRRRISTYEAIRPSIVGLGRGPYGLKVYSSVGEIIRTSSQEQKLPHNQAMSEGMDQPAIVSGSKKYSYMWPPPASVFPLTLLIG